VLNCIDLYHKSFDTYRKFPNLPYIRKVELSKVNNGKGIPGNI
jgi:hypothetical protein